jgi:hypothetical protein
MINKKPVQIERGMRGNHKDYDPDEKSIYDPLAKEAMIKSLNKTFPNLHHIENPNPYGIDVLTLNEDDKVTACWELEVRHGNWQGNKPFPFKKVNCIERKDYQWRRDQKFLDNIPYEMADKYKVFYVQMNKECTRAAIINGNTVLKYPLKSWDNRKKFGEFVRQVPIEEAIQIKLG